MIKALIFDFDGVLVLSEEPRFKILQAIAQHHNLIINDELFRNIIGRTTKDFFDLNFPSLDSNIRSDIIADYTTEFKDKIVDHITPITFTNDFIRNYTGNKVFAITSGSDTPIIEKVLSHIGLRDKISCIVGKEHVTKHKPDPQAYQYTARQLQLPPQECIVYEDTASGTQSALNAGMQVYAVLNGTNSKADFKSLRVSGYISTLQDLVNIDTSYISN